MKVSVVIPVYNEEKYIKKCLDSLMKQIDPPNEIIVVDNNSTDKTVEIIKKFPVRIVYETQQGTTQARNRGFNEARYEIIARTDADTILPYNWIKNIKNNIKDSSTVGITGATLFYDAPFAQLITNIQTYIFFKISKVFLGHIPLYGPNCAIKKKFWEKIKNSVCLNDKEVHEDMDLAMHLAPYGNICFIPSLQIKVSARRIKQNLYSILLDYSYRWFRTMLFHKHGLF